MQPKAIHTTCWYNWWRNTQFSVWWIYLNIRIFPIQMFIRIFVRIQIYSDIHLHRFIDSTIFGYTFVSKLIRMSHIDADVSGSNLDAIKAYIRVHPYVHIGCHLVFYVSHYFVYLSPFNSFFLVFSNHVHSIISDPFQQFCHLMSSPECSTSVVWVERERQPWADNFLTLLQYFCNICTKYLGNIWAIFSNT